MEVTRNDDVTVTWPLLYLGLYKDAPYPLQEVISLSDKGTTLEN
jgi:hypothetical protein